MAKRTIVNASGVTVVDVEPELVDSGHAPAGGLTAVERLAKLRGHDGPRESGIAEVKFDGETWFLKQFDWTDTTLVGILLGREGVTVKDGKLASVGAQTARDLSVIEAFTAVLLHVGVTCGTEKPFRDTPYFTIDVAKEYARERTINAKGLIGFLFSKLTDLNPEVLPLLQGTLLPAKPSPEPTI